MKEPIPKKEQKDRRISTLKTWVAMMGASIATSGCEMPDYIPKRGSANKIYWHGYHGKDRYRKDVHVAPSPPPLREGGFDNNPLLKEAHDKSLERARVLYHGLHLPEKEKEQLRNDIDLLKEALGDSAKFVFHPSIEGIRLLLDDYKSSKDNDLSPEELHKNAQHLSSFTLSHVGRYFKEDPRVNIEQFGETSKLVHEITSKEWPELFKRNIGTIRFFPERSFHHPLVNGKIAAAASSYQNQEEDIIFFKGGLLSIRETVRSLNHEAGHAVDYRAREKMRVTQRVSMIKEVYLRVIASDRFKSSYVESISTGTPQRNLAAKINEYWAEIVEEAMVNYDEFKKNSPKDFALVQKYVFNLNPEFKPKESSKRTQELISEYVQQKSYKAFLKELNETIPESVNHRAVVLEYARIRPSLKHAKTRKEIGDLCKPLAKMLESATGQQGNKTDLLILKIGELFYMYPASVKRYLAKK